MKKLIAMLAAVLCAAPMVWGQATVTGTVVDRKGKPLPGVKVEIPGSTEFTISDLDGTFKITPQSANDKKAMFSYAGMNTRKKKIKDGMKIKMKEYNWWSQKPEEWNWFANAIVAIPTTDKPVTPAYGFMLGRVKKWGYYVKGVTNTFGVKTSGTFDDYHSSLPGIWKDHKNRYWSVTGGLLLRLGCPIHLYAGWGYSSFTFCDQTINGDWYEDVGYSAKGLALDAGLLIRFNRLTLTVGTTVSKGQDASGNYHLDDYYPEGYIGNFGIGYSF